MFLEPSPLFLSGGSDTTHGHVKSLSFGGRPRESNCSCHEVGWQSTWIWIFFSADAFSLCGEVENLQIFFFLLQRNFYQQRSWLLERWVLQLAGKCGGRSWAFIASLTGGASAGGSVHLCSDVYTKSKVNSNLILNVTSVSFYLLSENRMSFAQVFFLKKTH